MIPPTVGAKVLYYPMSDPPEDKARFTPHEATITGIVNERIIHIQGTDQNGNAFMAEFMRLLQDNDAPGVGDVPHGGHCVWPSAGAGKPSPLKTILGTLGLGGGQQA